MSIPSKGGERNMKPLLSDIKVLELGQIVAGPTAGLIFSELGAEVIKIERPNGGDQFRARPDQSFFSRFNCNKRSMVLDLKNPQGKEIFFRLLKTADVVVDNYAPGVLERLGLGYETMHRTNPKIIHCSIKGFLPGPYGDRPLLDEPAQMMGGLAYMTGPPGQPLRAGTSIIDMSGAMFGVIGILGALHERQKTGRGQEIQVGLFETTVFFVAQHMAMAGVTGICPPTMPERGMGKNAGWAVYKIFVTQDQKQLFVAITSDAHWERFCKEFQVHDLWKDSSLRTNAGRVKQHALVNERVKEIVGGLTRDSLIERLEKSEVPYAIVNTPMDLFQDPHLRGRGHLFRVTTPKGGSTELPALPMILSSWPGPPRTNPPKLGEHTLEIMADLGYSADQIEVLIQEGVIASVVPGLNL
jgi:crotonobetainyl-CoA:carnitine CoA-transferase CaiB-like acyl-CoA transferase